MGVQGLWGMVLFGAFGVFYQDRVVVHLIIDLQIVNVKKIEEKKLFMSVIQNLSEHRGNSCLQNCSAREFEAFVWLIGERRYSVVAQIFIHLNRFMN